MKTVYLLTAEHFSVPGTIEKVFLNHDNAVNEAIRLVQLLLDDTSDFEPEESLTANTWQDIADDLENHHVGDCFVNLREIDLEDAESSQ